MYMRNWPNRANGAACLTGLILSGMVRGHALAKSAQKGAALWRSPSPPGAPRFHSDFAIVAA